MEAMTPTWNTTDWSYLLGVIHGDGHIAPRSVSICVGYKDVGYKDVLQSLLEELGFGPKLYRARSAFRLDVHNAVFAREMRLFKSNGKWSLPKNVDPAAYVSGVIDTDGCVGTASTKKISLTLKASGNAELVRRNLIAIGICGLTVHTRTTTYNGTPYDVETLNIGGMDRIAHLAPLLTLRHPRKQERLSAMLLHVNALISQRPVWHQVGEWLQREGDKSWHEIAAHFNLTKAQFDSVMGNLKLHAKVEVIPPPKVLHKYRVKDLSYFREK